MCSLNACSCDFNDDITPKIDAIQILNSDVCKKCRTNSTEIILRRKDGYCTSCFLINTTHKFRAALGKSKIIHRGDTILIGHCGRDNSTALLHLINSGMSETTHKKIIFNVVIFFIDDGIVEGYTVNERKKMLDTISKQVKMFGFVGYTASLQESLRENDVPNIYLMDAPEVVIDESDVISNMLNNLADDSAREELLRQLRHRLLILAARKLECNKVFVADCATNIAVNILSDISLGRGAQLSPDIDFSDTRYTDVMLLRPMKDFTKEEIIHYLSCNKLNAVRSSKQNRTSLSTSIQSLTNKFISQLNTEFHGTVSTVFRTGGKLSTELLACQNLEENSVCAMCNIPLDTKVTNNEISALQATTFSALLSSNNIDIDNTKVKANDLLNVNPEELTVQVNHSEENNQNEHNDSNITNGKQCTWNIEEYKRFKTQSLSLNDILKHLCYSCRLIFRSSDIKSIPSFVLNTIQTRLSHEIRPNEITDLLL
ncbi:hypothetical protein HZH68_003111 [Vespula germanica]|uniref:Cytoplasmic tRNA 2-thiolation protein 2 n=1 Tax=Vespula germanica TaxID=30212 RepID=A0A834NNM7_VESGE|nr:hypothetical protein HZH68_003111 [Vespula germanica]